ncbi:IS1595 family transposase, partial [Algoriphagus sp. C2-6-M1]|nr:IS1595 family transposase [Algoriphagus sp. C2-6-M1]MEB2782495.1 IS1595 family transposase [Algoriphagus sp. C2-6-M1]MEB2782982.1 IS1595 family transposase [Algoriphagus sp. C2-6-M1]
YRTNRSQSKETIFHNLINRMVKAEKLYIQNLI